MKGKITLIQILLIFVFVICITLLWGELSDRKKDKNNIVTVKEAITTQSPDNVTRTDTKEARLNKYKALYEQNNDTVGWIRIADTNIDYPVVQSIQSNAYYLHRDFNREYSSSGIPFMDYQCSIDPQSDNTIIYAHNMRNGTMFHDLLKYKDREFYESHKVIEFDTLKDVCKYEIFAVFHTQVDEKNEFQYYNFVNADTDADFDKFIAQCIKQSLYKTDIIPVRGDKILTLSTCSYNTDNERFVVFARKITV